MKQQGARLLALSLFLSPSGMTLEINAAKSQKCSQWRQHPDFRRERGLPSVVVGFDTYGAIRIPRFGKDAPGGFESQVSNAAPPPPKKKKTGQETLWERLGEVCQRLQQLALWRPGLEG